jgi:N-acetyl-anhydromuramyl-L-alanine amidase AmpD
MTPLELQRALFRLGYDPGGCDGVLGPKTGAAVDAFLAAHSLVSCELDRALGEALELVPPLVLAAHYTPANRPHSSPIDVVVIHTMEAPEKPKTARNVAAWFAGSSAPQASAHYCVDDVDVVQCVLECDVAWHAPGANANGIGVEHAGYASQTPDQWADDYSVAVLERSAKLVARLCQRFGIPVARLSVAELAAGGRGICGHVDVTNAFNGGRGHTDPGDAFPWDRYVGLVGQSLGVPWDRYLERVASVAG